MSGERLAPEVHLADVLRAWGRLDARDHETRAAIAALLGFELAAPRAKQPRRKGGSGEGGGGTTSTTEQVGRGASGPTTVPRPVRTELVDDDEEPAPGAGAETNAPIRPVWLSGAPMPPAGAWTPPPRPPLLHPVRTRALVAGFTSVPLPRGEIDVERLVEELVSLRSVSTLPRLLVPSVVAGVQLLLDVGPGMEPFVGDLQDLAASVRAVVGRDAVETHRFTALPGRFGPSLVARRPYAFPSAGTPVLAATDLGIGGVGGASADDWAGFAVDVRRATGHRLVVLVPYSRARWPAEVAREAQLLEWDRSTTPQTVRSAFARAGGAR
jgi:hypothetical protein